MLFLNQRMHIFCFYWCARIKTDMFLSLYLQHKFKPKLKYFGFKVRQSKEDQTSFPVLRDRISIRVHYFEMTLSFDQKDVS